MRAPRAGTRPRCQVDIRGGDCDSGRSGWWRSIARGERDGDNLLRGRRRGWVCVGEVPVRAGVGRGGEETASEGRGWGGCARKGRGVPEAQLFAPPPPLQSALELGPLVERDDKAPEWGEGEKERGDLDVGLDGD